MICAYLMFAKVSKTAAEVLDYNRSKRTFNSNGVTIPSQQRYVDYFSTKISQELQYNPVMWDLPTMKLTFSSKFSSISWHLSSQGSTARLFLISNPHWPYVEMSRYPSPRSWHSMFFTWGTSQSSFQVFLTLNCSTFGWTLCLLTKKFPPS